MCVQQSLDILPVDNTDFPTEGSKMVEVPRGLKQRWKPFGWSEHSILTNHEYKSGNLAWVINMHGGFKPLWQHNSFPGCDRASTPLSGTDLLPMKCMLQPQDGYPGCQQDEETVVLEV